MVEEVIGFDIGHGESAAACMALLPSATPDVLEIDGVKCQISAVGGLRGGEVLIGDQALRDERVTTIKLGFKQRPPGTVEANESLRLFVREYHQRLVSSKKILGGEKSFYFVGCPSSWTQDEQAAYESLLAEELPAVRVVRESRAALLQAREAGRISSELIRGTILVIDVGSSTTDVSLVVGGIQEKTLDFGTQLGGYLLDKAILDYAITTSPQRVIIEEFFMARPDARVRCERFCRRAKEDFWNANEYTQRRGVSFFFRIEPSDVVLGFRLDGALMESILALPRSELGGVSWIGVFEELLGQVQELLRKREATLNSLILTGGVSRMACVRRLCEQYFPFPETKFVWLTPPDEAVAMGLARWGVLYFQTSGFIEDVERVCSMAVPAAVIKQALSIKARLADEVSSGLAKDVVKPILREWRAGTWRTLDNMQGQLKARVEAWLASKAGRTTIQRACAVPLRAIYSEINSATLDICTKHGLPHSSLRLEVDVEVESEKIDLAVGSPFEAITGVAMGVSLSVLFVLTGIAHGVLLTASLSTGPPGWLVGALLAGWVAVFGAMKLEEEVSAWDIPLPVRRTFLSNARCNSITEDAKGRLREHLLENIGESDLERIRHAVSRQVSMQLTMRADEVRWIIS